MQTIGYAALQVIPSMRGTVKALEAELNGAMPNLGATAGESFGSRLFDGIQTWARRGTLAVAGIATAVSAMALKGGISRALDTEDAIIQMRRMGLATDEVNFLVDQVDKTFDGSIFSNPAGFKLAGLLHGTEVQLEKIPGVMGTIADFAAHGNVPLEQMSDIFLQVIGSGRVTATTFNRLTAAGVPLSQLANGLGMTTSEMRALATSGEFTADMFLEAAAGAEMFQGAAKSAGDGTRGAFSNVLTQIRVLGQRVVSPIFGENGPMVTFFKATRQALIDVRPLFSNVGQVVAGVLVPALAGATEWLGKVPELVAKISGGGMTDLPILDLLSGLMVILNPLGAVVQGVLPALEGVGDSLRLMGEAAGGALAAVLPTVAEAFVALAEAVGGSLIEILPSVAGVLEVIAGMLPELVAAFAPLLPMVADLAVAAVELVTPLLANEDVLVALVGAFVAWKAAMAGVALTGLITRLVTATGAIVAKTAAWVANAAAMVASKAQTVAIAAMYAGDFVKRIGAATAALAGNTLQWIRNAATAAASAAKAAAAAVAGAARQAAAWALLGVQAALGAARSAAAWVAGVIAPAASATAAMVAQVARQVGAWVLLGVQSMLGAAKVAAAWLIAMGPVALVIAAVVGLVALIVANWDAIVEWTKAAWENVVAWLTGAWDTIVETATAVWDGIVSFFSGVWDSITTTITDRWNAIGDFFAGLWSAISGAVETAWNAVVDFFRAIPGRVLEFFLNWTLPGLLITHWDTIKATAVSAWNALVDWIKGIPGRFLDGLRAIGNLAGDMARWVTGIRDKAVEKFLDLVDWVKGVPGRILDGLGNVRTMLLDAGRNIMQGLWDGLTEKFEQVKGWVTGIGDWIANNKGPKAYDLALLRPAGRWIITGLGGGLREGLPGLRDDLAAVTDEFAALRDLDVSLEPVRPEVRPAVLPPDDAAGVFAGASRGGDTYEVTVTIPVERIRDLVTLTDFFSEVRGLARAKVGVA